MTDAPSSQSSQDVRVSAEAPRTEQSDGYVLVSPDDVIVVAQVELLGVLSGVVHHPHSSHEVHQLLPCGVVQVVPTLVTSVPVDPLQPELAARRRLVRHGCSKASNGKEDSNVGSEVTACSSVQTPRGHQKSLPRQRTARSVSMTPAAGPKGSANPPAELDSP